MTSNNNNWVSKGGLAGAKRHNKELDLGIGINSELGQTKSTCYKNLTGTKKKPLNTTKTISKPKSCTKKANNVNRCSRIEAKFIKAYNDRKYAKAPTRKTRKKFKDNIQVWRAN